MNYPKLNSISSFLQSSKTQEVDFLHICSPTNVGQLFTIQQETGPIATGTQASHVSLKITKSNQNPCSLFLPVQNVPES